MPYQTILVPYDGSDHAKSALSTAFMLARNTPGAHVHLLHVTPYNAVGAFGEGNSVDEADAIAARESYTELFERALSAIKAEMRDYMVTALDGLEEERVTLAVEPNPSAVRGIADYAHEHECDLIVMGRRGLGALRGMLGSVSFGVLRSVDIPVLTVK